MHRPSPKSHLIILFFLIALAFPFVSLADSSNSPASISGWVWNDWDEDGLRDPEEPLLQDVLIVLANAKGDILAHTYTDADGAYSFEGLDAGSYILFETDPQGYSSSTPNVVPIQLEEGEQAQSSFLW